MKRIRILLITVIIACMITTTGNYGISMAAVSRMPKLNVRVLNITKSSSYKLRVYNTLATYTVLFESADNSIVSISKPKDNSCRVNPKSSGNTTIFAYVYDSDDELVSTLTCKVIVSPTAASVKFKKKRYALCEGTTKKIKAVIKPNISNEMPLYSSDDISVATVSSNGTVTAISAGQTVIHATISNGRSSSYTLIVTKSGNSKPASSATPATPRPSQEPDSVNPQNNPSRSETSKNKHDFSHYNYEPLSTPVVTCDEL